MAVINYLKSGNGSNQELKNLIQRSTTSINIPNGTTSIGNHAFAYCYYLTNVNIPNSVTTIGTSSFMSCERLEQIVIPSSVISNGQACFSGCSSLRSVKYVGQVPTIQGFCFTNCNNVELYDFRNCTTVPARDQSGGFGYKTGCQIVIPDNLYSSWTTNSDWSSLPTDTSLSRYVVWVKASEYVE